MFTKRDFVKRDIGDDFIQNYLGLFCRAKIRQCGYARVILLLLNCDIHQACLFPFLFVIFRIDYLSNYIIYQIYIIRQKIKGLCKYCFRNNQGRCQVLFNFNMFLSLTDIFSLNMI